MVEGQDVPPQPFGQPLGVGDRRAPEPENGADLFPVPLAAAARQVVLRERVRLDPELVGEMIPCPDRDLPPVAGEPTFHLEELQQDGEAESASVGSVGQQFPLVEPKDQCSASSCSSQYRFTIPSPPPSDVGDGRGYPNRGKLREVDFWL